MAVVMGLTGCSFIFARAPHRPDCTRSLNPPLVDAVAAIPFAVVATSLLREGYGTCETWDCAGPDSYKLPGLGLAGIAAVFVASSVYGVWRATEPCEAGHAQVPSLPQ